MYNGTGYPVQAVSQLREESRDGLQRETEDLGALINNDPRLT